MPNPQVSVVSQLSWGDVTIPQVAIPVTIGGKKYLVEVDEFSTDSPGARSPPRGQRRGRRRGAHHRHRRRDQAPRVVSNLRLEVNQPENRAKIANDPGAGSSLQGYAAHYCNVPTGRPRDRGLLVHRVGPARVRHPRPRHPKEIAYFIAPHASPGFQPKSDYAMSKPEFDPEHGEIWYADGNSGFYALQVTNGVWPFGSQRHRIGTGRTWAPNRQPLREPALFTIHLRAPHGQRLRGALVYIGKRRVRVLTARGCMRSSTCTACPRRPSA